MRRREHRRRCHHENEQRENLLDPSGVKHHFLLAFPPRAGLTQWPMGTGAIRFRGQSHLFSWTGRLNGRDYITPLLAAATTSTLDDAGPALMPLQDFRP